jgi:tetratricopeptide (TPR) repeat protein
MKRKSIFLRFRSFTSNSLCAVVLMFGVALAHGQGKRAPAATGNPSFTQNPTPSSLSLDQVKAGDGSAPASSKPEDSCFLPPLTGMHSGTVEVADLQVPPKAQKEYEDGCAAVKSRKMADAETHLRKVVKAYEKYASAWVLLGQVLEARQKNDEARDACSHPLTSLANYLPSYLCLTDISARLNHWDEVLKFSTRAIEIEPAANAAAYAYNATANLNLRHLPDAEKSALRASEIDTNHSDPRLHYLLAQIYAAKGDLASAAAQLREYLKFATDPDDAIVVKNYLAKLEGQSGK